MECIPDLLQEITLTDRLRQFTNHATANLLKLICQRDHIIRYFLVRMGLFHCSNYLLLEVRRKDDLQFDLPGFGAFAYFADIRVGAFLGAVSANAFYVKAALAIVPYVSSPGFKNGCTNFLRII